MTLFGITGGIGMGKSTVGQFLSKSGMPVIDSDTIARSVVEPGQPALQEIRDCFGSQVITSSGELDRQAMARLVFSDSQQRKKLEAILHPRIRQAWRDQAELFRRENRPHAAILIPLLFETDAQSEFDCVVCVACIRATQVARLTARGWSLDEIHARIASQMPVEKKMSLAHRVIWSEGSLDVLQAQLKCLMTFRQR